MPALMPSHTIPLALAKSTKGTHVFANEDQGISGLYLPKLLLPGGPEGYSVTVVITKSGSPAPAASDEL